MRLHYEMTIIAVKPSAAVAIAYFHKIHGTVVFAGPIVVDVPDGGIEQDNASRAKQGHHAAICKSDVTIPMACVAVVVGKNPFKLTPLLDHAGEKLGAARIEGWIEPQGYAQSSRWGSEMRLRSWEHRAIHEEFIQRNFIPAEEFKGIAMVDG